MIEDGVGQGYKAKVDNLNRLHTHGTTRSEEEFGAIKGQTYNVNTSTISLTSANESAVFYCKNTGDEDIFISTIGYLLGNSTSGTGDVHLTVLRNPTAGTIVTNAVAAPVEINKNFGSSKSLAADTYKGVEGDTFTDGDVAYRSLLAGAARTYVINTGNIVLTRGTSIGIKITPQTSNTAMDVQLFFSVLSSENIDS